MCKQCEPRCPPKHCKKCVEKHVIKCLPYNIHKPGQYCLGKDFTWSDAAQSAITITADNVVLDFNQRVITITVESFVPLVLVDGVTDVVLDNVHLKATGVAQNQSVGISLQSSNNVEVNDAVLLDLNNSSLVANFVNGLSLTNLYVKNLISRTFAVSFFNCKNISHFDGKISGARNLFVDCSIVTIERLQLDNSFAESGLSGPDRGVQISRSSNVIIKDSNLHAGNAVIIFGTYDGETDTYIDLNLLVENNVIKTTVGDSAGIFLIRGSGFTFRGNQIKSLGDFFAPGGIQVVAGRHGTVSNNTVIGNLSNPSWGIAFASIYGPAGYMNVNDNFVTNSYTGYADHAFGLQATCCVFKNNVGTGNVDNDNFISPNTVNDPSNIFGCELVAPLSVQKTDVLNLEEKLEFLTK